MSGQTKDYFELVKAIGESKSKQEEDRIITEEVIYLKKAFQQPGVNKKKLKELVIRSVYVEMLGQDASFAYIKAVELCASTTITQKKVGYLAASLCFAPTHEFRFMLVNMVQRDMKSTSMLEVCAALVAVCKLVTEDMIPAVIGDVVNLLKHDMEVVRKKAISTLHRFYQMDKRAVLDHVDKIRRALCDKDPCVMAATLPLFSAMISDDVLTFKDLVPSFVSILKQIVEHRLPRDYDYHRIPSPWIQMWLLQILGQLGRGDQSASEGMYEVIAEVMKRADTGINVGYAIVYECVKTVTTIYPNTILLDAAATAISRFIRSESHNLKYIGIKGLASIVKDHPKYAGDHQMAVIDCLEDPDDTLKRKTLDLLFRMTNAVNVEFIVDKLLHFLHPSTNPDDYFRTELVTQITQCAERFAPSNTWYVQTIVKVFELAGDKVNHSVAQTLTQLIAEGVEAEDDDDEEEDEDDEEGEGNGGKKKQSKDDELRGEAVEHFLDLLNNNKKKIPAILAQTLAWILGEYGYLSTSCSKEEIMEKLCNLFLIKSGSLSSSSSASSSSSSSLGLNSSSNVADHGQDEMTKAMIITAWSKLIAQSGTCPSKILQLITTYAQSRSMEVQQRCLEVLALLKASNDVMVDVLPVDASCEDIEVDEGLSFLTEFVQQAKRQGAREYEVPEEYLQALAAEEEGLLTSSARSMGLKITPYAAPKLPVVNNVAIVAGGGATMMTAASATAAAAANLVGGVNSVPIAGSGGLGGNNANMAATQGNQLLNTSSGSRLGGGGVGGGSSGLAPVWGMPKPAPPPPAPAPVVAAPSSAPSTPIVVVPISSTISNGQQQQQQWGNNNNNNNGINLPPAPPIVASPPKPKVLTEKEKMAQALFGGMSSSSGNKNNNSTAANSKRKSTTGTVGPASPAAPTAAAAPYPPTASPPTQQPAVLAQQQPPATMDIFQNMNTAISSTVPVSAATPSSMAVNISAKTAAASSSSIYDDILDLGMNTPATALSASSMLTQAPSGSNNYQNSNSGMSLSSLSSVGSSPPAPAVNNAHVISDVFANIDLTGSLGGGAGGMGGSSSSDLNIKPYVMNTQEFGRRWGSLTCEAKQSLACGHFPRLDIETLKRAIPMGTNYHHVETIPATMESIFAATATSLGAIVLLHVKMNPGRRQVDLLVKSNTQEVVQKEISSLSLAVSSFRG